MIVASHLLKYSDDAYCIFIHDALIISFSSSGGFFTDKKKGNRGVEDFHSFMSMFLYIYCLIILAFLAAALDTLVLPLPLLAVVPLWQG